MIKKLRRKHNDKGPIECEYNKGSYSMILAIN